MSILLSRTSLHSHANAAALGAAALALSGCVTRGYKLAPRIRPRRWRFIWRRRNHRSGRPCTRSSCIKDPARGSAKAFRDEYVVSATNRGPAPLTIDSVVLHDQQGAPINPGVDPWALERLSKKWWETNGARQTGTYVVLGAGTVVGAGMAVASAYSELWGASVSAGARHPHRKPPPALNRLQDLFRHEPVF